MQVPINQLVLVQRLVFGALLASVGIYGVVVHVAAAGMEVTAPPMLRIALAGAAVVTAAAIPVLRRVLMPPVEEASPYHGHATPLPTELSPELTRKVWTVSVLVWALSEAVAVYGVVLAFGFGDPQQFWPFGGAAVVLLLTNAPRRARLEAVARASAASK